MVSFAALSVIIILLLCYSDVLDFLLKVDIDTIREVANENIMYILFLMFVIMILQNMFTVIPLILVISVNITLFGLFYGFIWSWVTSLLGGVVVFLASRFWFQGLLIRRVSSEWMGKIEKKGAWFVFWGRIFPLAPSNLINIAAGVSSIQLKHFMLGTLLGNGIYSIVLSFISDGILSFSLTSPLDITICVGVIIIVVGYYVLKYSKKRRRNHEMP